MYNYKEKLEYRNNLLNNINNNKNNLDNLTTIEWYKKYMPFLPKQVIDIIPQLEKIKDDNNKQEECYEYLKILFNN